MMLPYFGTKGVPSSVLDFPSMTTMEEKALLYWCAKEFYTGSGVIIDAGVFLGGSTNALACGLNDNTARKTSFSQPIQSYDIAVWVASMDRYLENEHVATAFEGQKPSPGVSFETVLRRLLESQKTLIRFHIGNIVETAHSDVPVEIAFYDCLKTNERDIAVFQAFAPKYIPGQTLVLQQDYFYESAAYNKIRQEYFAEYFQFVGQVSNTAVFLYVKAIPDDLFQSDPVTELPLSEKIVLLERAALRAENNKTGILTKLSIVDFLIEERRARQAADRLNAIEAEMSSLSLDEITRRPENIVRGFKKRIEAIR